MTLQRIRILLIVFAVAIVAGSIWYALKPSADVTELQSIGYLTEDQLNTGEFNSTEYRDGKIQLVPQ